ncbi:MAG: flagellar M-ring protein FliF [Rhizobiales bacterium]|nr:flagellar M-ring protein FliF [Hyphomicrobiales bacterium]
MQYVSLLVNALAQLGARRLIVLGLVGAFVFGLLTTGTYYLNRPVREPLYTGLDAEDINRIGRVLSEVGIPYDVSVGGDAVLVDYGNAAQARMILAEKGLPKSDKAGYELFDQMGSLGLTSFMQQVTKVRALEGELARTIELLEGIRSARVHLGQKGEGAFRSKADQPTASVVIKTDGNAKESLASSVRQIVASAIPGLKSEQVTVMTTDGQTLVSGGETGMAEPDRKLQLEQRVAEETRQSAERAISAMVGLTNLRVSVTAQLNADKRQTTETNFDPESKIERSLKTVKESQENQNSTGSETTSVAQNIPQEPTAPSGGDSSREKKDRKEETANYELNSKQVAVESVGYTIERLSLSILLNKQTLLKSQGAAPDEAKLVNQVQEIESLVRSAVGFNEKRGDSIKVVAADFIAEDAGPRFRRHVAVHRNPHGQPRHAHQCGEFADRLRARSGSWAPPRSESHPRVQI